MIGARHQESGVQRSGIQQSATSAPPTSLLDALSERWQPLAASAVGRVLELPADGVEAAVRSECSRGARYDTILSFMRTPQVSDLDGFVAALGEILADEGRILMMEPSGSGNGRLGRLRGWLPSGSRNGRLRGWLPSGFGNGRLRGWLPSRIGHPRPHRDRAERDVLSALRAGGFTVTDLHRRELASVPSQWRRYVEIRARRESPWASQP